MADIQKKRLAKEIKQMALSPPVSSHPPLSDRLIFCKRQPGVELLNVADLSEIFIGIKGAEETLYAEEMFKLRFRFSDGYPMDSPEVVFVKENGIEIPVHPHVYTNGHICLSILYDQWSPALTISSVCLSILSMLSSAEKKELPPDDKQYCSTHKDKSPKKTQWWFHDDKV